jgi:hypothetical protein
MGFRGENNLATPWAATFTDPFVGKQNFHLTHYYFTFVGAIVGLGAAGRLTFTSIYNEFEASDAFCNACFVESIPVALDHQRELRFDFWGNIFTNAKVFPELIGIGIGVPGAEVVAWWQVTEYWCSLNSRAVLLENEDVVVEVVIQVVGLESIPGFWSPDFGGDFNAEGCSWMWVVGRAEGGFGVIADYEMVSGNWCGECVLVFVYVK